MQFNGELETYFKEEIDRLSNNEIKKIEDEITQIRTKALQELEVEVKKEAAQRMDLELKDMLSEHAVALSKLNEEKNRRLMNARDDLTKRLFQSAIDELTKFQNGKEYLPFLCDKIKQLQGKVSGKAILYVAVKEEGILKTLMQAYHDEIEGKVDKTIQIGGFRLECPNSGIVIDETFDASIAEEKEWFYSHSGLIIQ